MRPSCRTHPLITFVVIAVLFVLPQVISGILTPVMVSGGLGEWIPGMRLFADILAAVIALCAYQLVFPSRRTWLTAADRSKSTNTKSKPWCIYVAAIAAVGICAQLLVAVIAPSPAPSAAGAFVASGLSLQPSEVIMLLVICFATAIGEETVFRGLAIPLFARYELQEQEVATATDLPSGEADPTSKVIPPRILLRACLLSAVFFGLFHLGNLGEIANGPIPVLLKIVQAMLFGFSLAGILIATRSLWTCIWVHLAFNLIYFSPLCVTDPGTVLLGLVSEPLGVVAMVVTIVLFLPACAKALQWIKDAVIPYTRA